MGLSKRRCKKRAKERRRRHQLLLEQSFRLVFSHVLQQGPGNSGELYQRQESMAKNLAMLQPLTAVCKSWRKASLPLFYHTAICSIRQVVGRDSNRHEESGISSTKVVSNTNVSLIVLGGYEKHVRRLAIDLVGDIPPDLLVSQLDEAEFSKTSWPCIKTLQLEHWHGHPLQRPVHSAESLAIFNAYLLHNLPNLASVKYNSIGDYRYYQEFPLNGLLASSLSRLNKLDIHSGIVPGLGSSAFLPMLTSLTLRCPIKSCAAHLPRIFAESLRNLHIGFSSADTIWDRFYVAKGKQHIVFARLKSLVLEYMAPIVDKSCKCNGVARKCCKIPLAPLGGKQQNSTSKGTGDSRVVSAGGNRLESIYYYSSSDDGDDDDSSGIDSMFDFGYNERGWSSTEEIFGYSSGSLELQKMQRPSFPRLDQLTVCKYPYQITNILKHFPVELIPNISIRDIAKGYWVDGLTAESTCNMSRLRVHVARSGYFQSKWEEKRYQVWINRLFAVSSTSMSHLWLDAPTTAPITLPDIVGLTSLVTLSLGMKMDLGTIPTLLSQLPCLRKLAMHIHPQSTWLLRNEGVLAYDDSNSRLLSHLPCLSNSLQCLVAYVDLMELGASDCRSRHGRDNSGYSNKCCRRRCQFCEKCNRSGHNHEELDNDESRNLENGDEDGDKSTNIIAVERELVWVIARIPSLAVLGTEKSTSRAVKKCIAELMSHTAIIPRIRHLARMRISVWEYY
ncbi:hypothetical protein BX070DRAFT_233079 [Coemansia spiralis]|nr:hypothetical protein BX070DRAFT_233079 [Coemansia spiralis]